MLVLIYIDNFLIFSRGSFYIDCLVKSLFEGSENFVIIQELIIDKYFGVEARDYYVGMYEFAKLHLMSISLKILNLPEEDIKHKPTPVRFSVLYKDLSSIVCC